MSILPRETLQDWPELYEVDSQNGFFMSGLRSRKTFEPGQLMVPITGFTEIPQATWSSYQCGLGSHVEVNSVLVFMNHSCSPNVVIDMSSPDRSEWHARALKKINPGDELTTFYPSTEWDSPQPFDCRCKSENCLGYYRGSKYLSRQRVEESGYNSPWVSHLMNERDVNGSDKI